MQNLPFYSGRKYCSFLESRASGGHSVMSPGCLSAAGLRQLDEAGSGPNLSNLDSTNPFDGCYQLGPCGIRVGTKVH